MPQFAYKAKRRTGEMVQGVVDVADRAAALVQIERLGLFPVMVDASKVSVAAAEKAEKTKAKDAAAKPAAVQLPAIFGKRRQRRPKLQELATYTTQLANLLKCGMPLTVALQSMSHLESKGIPSDVSKQLRQEVMEGRSLSDAMGKPGFAFHPRLAETVTGRGITGHHLSITHEKSVACAFVVLETGERAS